MDDREKIFNEIVETERKYLASLDLLNKLYLKPIEKNKHMKLSPELKNIMSTLTIILNINQTLLKKMESSNKDAIGAAFKNVIPFLKAYTSYFNSYENASNDIRNAKKENKKFAEWLEKTEKAAKKNGQLAMNSYLIQPVQRIPRYNLLLNELIKKTDKTHEDYNNLSVCLAETKKVAAHLDCAIEEMDNRAKMALIQRNLMSNDGKFSKVSIVQPHRKFVSELEVFLLPSQMGLTQQDPITFMNYTADKNEQAIRYLFLFSDILLVCKKSTKEEQMTFNSLKQHRDMNDRASVRKSQMLFRMSMGQQTGDALDSEFAQDGGSSASPLYVVMDQIQLTSVPIVAAHSCTEFDSFYEFSKRFPNMTQIATKAQTLTFFSNDETKAAKWVSKFSSSIASLVKNTNYNMVDQPFCKRKGYPDEVIEYCVSTIQRCVVASLERDNIKKGMYILPRSVTEPVVNNVLAMSDEVILSVYNQETEQWDLLVEGSVILEKNPSQPGSFKFRFSDYVDSKRDCEFVMTSDRHIRVDEVQIFHFWETDTSDYALQLPNLQISRKLEQLYDMEIIMSINNAIQTTALIDEKNAIEVASIEKVVVLQKDDTDNEWKFNSCGNIFIFKYEAEPEVLKFYFFDLSTGENRNTLLKDGKLPYVDPVNFLHTWFEDQSLYDDGTAIALQFPDGETSVKLESLYDTIRVNQPKSNEDVDTDDQEWNVSYTPHDIVKDESWYNKKEDEEQSTMQRLLQQQERIKNMQKMLEGDSTEEPQDGSPVSEDVEKPVETDQPMDNGETTPEPAVKQSTDTTDVVDDSSEEEPEKQPVEPEIELSPNNEPVEQQPTKIEQTQDEPEKPEEHHIPEPETSVAEPVSEPQPEPEPEVTQPETKPEPEPQSQSEPEPEPEVKRTATEKPPVESSTTEPETLIMDDTIPEWKRRILQKKKSTEESTSTTPNATDSKGSEDLETSGYYPWQIEIMRRKRALAAKVLTDVQQPTQQNSTEETNATHKRSFRDLRARFEASN